MFFCLFHLTISFRSQVILTLVTPTSPLSAIAQIEKNTLSLKFHDITQCLSTKIETHFVKYLKI